MRTLAERPEKSPGETLLLIRCMLALALLVGAHPAQGAERMVLKVQAKSAAEPSRIAPMREGAVEARPEFIPDPRLANEPIPGSCNVSTGVVCYDYRNGRAVFKPARELMPEIAGLRRENLTLKRDKITFSYSFK